MNLKNTVQEGFPRPSKICVTFWGSCLEILENVCSKNWENVRKM